MPRSFDLSAESPASVEQIHSAFSDEDYWLARLAGFGAGTATLDSLIVDADGTVIMATTLGLLRDRLPGLVTRLYLGDLEMLCNETWTPIRGGQVRGKVSMAIPGAPLSVLGAALLAPARSGSRLKYTTTVEVRVPLIGSNIETYVGGLLAEQIPAILRFTTVWIAENG